MQTVRIAKFSGKVAEQDTHKDWDEKQWLKRHLQGDSRAFALLVQAYRKPIYSYLVRCGISKFDRDDVFQDVFLKIHKAAASYQTNKPLHPWIFTIVANTVRNHLRDQTVRQLPTTPLDLQYDSNTEPADPRLHSGDLAEMHDTVTYLERAIATLPLVQREVLILTTIEGLKQQYVADILEIPVNTIKAHLRRARLALLKAQKASYAAGGRHDRL